MEIDTADPDAILLVASKGKTLHQAALQFRDSIVSGMEVWNAPQCNAACCCLMNIAVNRTKLLALYFL